ncbi:MAG TPA: hypothetical protein VHB73_07330 [Alphaproteobacteria bacterium]|nr:hypothetical protein [Alphaproteobacteria bacterium]
MVYSIDMKHFALPFAVFALLATLVGCEMQNYSASSSSSSAQPRLYPAVMEYWRPISDPNVFMPPPQANTKLNYDLAQCRCSNFPANYPHADSATMAPDLGRMAETGARMVDTQNGCVTTPQGVLLECMRARGWEPSSCSGRLETPGGTSCALSINDVPSYPESYPYRNPYDQSYGDEVSPPEQKQRYP